MRRAAGGAHRKRQQARTRRPKGRRPHTAGRCPTAAPHRERRRARRTRRAALRTHRRRETGPRGENCRDARRTRAGYEPRHIRGTVRARPGKRAGGGAAVRDRPGARPPEGPAGHGRKKACPDAKAEGRRTANAGPFAPYCDDQGRRMALAVKNAAKSATRAIEFPAAPPALRRAGRPRHAGSGVPAEWGVARGGQYAVGLRAVIISPPRPASRCGFVTGCTSPRWTGRT